MKSLLALLFFIGSITSLSSQDFKYWLEREYYMGEGKKALVTFYQATDGRTSYIKIKNESCFDLEYKVEVEYTDWATEAYASLTKTGTISAKESKTFTRNLPPNITQMKLPEHQDEDGYWISKTIFKSVRSLEEWIQHSRTLNCLGYDSPAAYQKEKENKAEAIRKKQQAAANEVEMQKEAKLQAFLDKGLSYHLKKYEKSIKSGSFFMQMPYDSAEIFAKYTGKYLLICNVGGVAPMKKDQLKLSAEDLKFLDESFLAVEDFNFTRDFGNWIRKKKIALKSTPAVILLDPSGKVVFNQSMTGDIFYKNFATWLRGIN